MFGTMQDFPLTIATILRHGAAVYGDSEVVTFEGDGARRATFAEVADARRAARGRARRASASSPATASARSAGTARSTSRRTSRSRAMGAVLHTLNIRLFPEQLTYVDQPRGGQGHHRRRLARSRCSPRSRPSSTTVERFVVIGDGDAGALAAAAPNAEILRYDELLAAEPPGFDWPEVDERLGRGDVLHDRHDRQPEGRRLLAPLGVPALARRDDAGRARRRRARPHPRRSCRCSTPTRGASRTRRSCAARRLRHAGPVPAGRAAHAHDQGGARRRSRARCPTIWADILRYGEEHEIDLSSLRMIICGGSAVPRSLMERVRGALRRAHRAGWGMTETSPLAAVAHPPAAVELGTRRGDGLARAHRPGRRRASSCASSTTPATPLPWDDEAVGEIEVRGPWITGSTTTATRRPRSSTTAGCAPATSASVNAHGYVQITDRAKDVIKSGGEWISSVELENHLMAHPDVVEASVIGVPDPRWDERPLACVVRKAGSSVDADGARARSSASRSRSGRCPSAGASSTRCPKTSVGKFDKKVLRARHEKGELAVDQAVE